MNGTTTKFIEETKMKKMMIAVRDIVANNTPMLGLANNEAQFVRDNTQIIMRMGMPLEDIQFQLVGTYDDETGLVEAMPQIKVIPKDIYKWKAEQVVENEAIKQAEKETKNE